MIVEAISKRYIDLKYLATMVPRVTMQFEKLCGVQ